MRVFVDTSAFYSLLDGSDRFHARAAKQWEELVFSEDVLFCSNYVLIETFALVQHRLGLNAVRIFNDDILPLIHVYWIEEPVHKAAVSALITASKKKLSLVDCDSFETMRHLEIRTAFTFDPHFARQSFACIP